MWNNLQKSLGTADSSIGSSLWCKKIEYKYDKISSENTERTGNTHNITHNNLQQLKCNAMEVAAVQLFKMFSSGVS